MSRPQGLRLVAPASQCSLSGYVAALRRSKRLGPCISTDGPPLVLLVLGHACNLQTRCLHIQSDYASIGSVSDACNVWRVPELVRETAVTRREAHAAARAGFDSPALRQ